MTIRSRIHLLSQRRIGSKKAAVLILLAGLMGYGLLRGHVVSSCYALDPAQVTSGVTIIGKSCYDFLSAQECEGNVTCETPGATSSATSQTRNDFKNKIEKQSRDFEEKVHDDVNKMTAAALENIEQLEKAMISWWDTLAFYNLGPAMKKMATQMNVDVIQQTKNIQQTTDVAAAENAKMESSVEEAKTAKTVPIDDNGCATATVSGGLGRAASFGKAMRSGVQNRGSDAGSNRRGTRGAAGKAAIEKAKSETYESTFCDPNDNGGQNVCGTTSNPAFYNADTKATEILFNMLTIPVTDKRYQAAVEAIVENMVGSPAADVIPADALKSPPGREKFMQRRSFMARYAAAGSTTRMIMGWRMPGAGPNMAQWVAELRKGGAAAPFVNDKDLSSNPSYREIIHAVTVDRFNSTGYAGSLVTTENAIEMEKLTLSTFYLIMLRDYYELLERTALTLAVQVSIMADQQPVIPTSKYTETK